MNGMIKQLPIMIRREMWEHKGSVLWVPVSFAGVIILTLILGLIFGSGGIKRHVGDVVDWGSEQRQLAVNEQTRSINFDTGAMEIDNDEKFEWLLWGSDVSNVMSGVLHGAAIAFQVIAFFVAVFYLLSSLHTDRVSRSILFWKSLPVSETSNVLVKLGFALLVIPFVALAITFIAQVMFSIVVAYLFSESQVYSFFDGLATANYLSVLITHGVLILLFAVKCLPLYSWLLLASAYAKSTPFMIAIIPPVAALFMEKLIFGTDYTERFIEYLFHPGTYDIQALRMKKFILTDLADVQFTLRGVVYPLLISAGFLSGAIWLRNHRYEI